MDSFEPPQTPVSEKAPTLAPSPSDFARQASEDSGALLSLYRDLENLPTSEIRARREAKQFAELFHVYPSMCQ